MEQRAEREPSMKGAPTYFRLGIVEAAGRKVIGRDVNTGKAVRSDYSVPAGHLAIHLEKYLSEEAYDELDAIFEIDDAPRFEAEFWAFLKREFPACVALVPPKRRAQFLEGFYAALENGRFPWGR